MELPRRPLPLQVGAPSHCLPLCLGEGINDGTLGNGRQARRDRDAGNAPLSESEWTEKERLRREAIYLRMRDCPAVRLIPRARASAAW
jgi:hypothetical protein